MSWRSTFILAILASLVTLLYQPVLVGLMRDWWNDENYSHGFLIPLMSAYFIWERRDRLQKLAPAPSAWGLALLVAGVGLLLLGNIAAELFTMRNSLLVVLTGLILYLRGWNHLKVLAFPILFLAFMIPLPAIVFNAIAFPLQLFAARMATAILQFIGIPVLREGNLITLAYTTLEVAEACSGIRSLISLLALATTYAYLTEKEFWRRGLLVVSAIPIAILANVGRVAGTGVVAHFFGPRIAESFFHTFSGWLIFLVATLLLVAEGFLLSRILPRESSDQGKAARAAINLERPTRSQQPLDRRQRARWRTGSAAAVLAVGIVSVLTLSAGEAVPVRRQLEGIPLRMAQWEGVRDALPPPVLSVLKVTDYIMRLYAKPEGPPIWLYVGYYASQRQGQTIHSPQNCLPGSGWNFLSRQYLTLRLPGREDPVTINRVLIGKGQERQVVLYWYQERGRIITSEYWAKVHLVTDAVTRNRTDGALIRLSSPVQGSEEETTRQLLEFAHLVFPALIEFLPE